MLLSSNDTADPAPSVVDQPASPDGWADLPVVPPAPAVPPGPEGGVPGAVDSVSAPAELELGFAEGVTVTPFELTDQDLVLDPLQEGLANGEIGFTPATRPSMRC
jgi:hypothetical protein